MVQQILPTNTFTTAKWIVSETSSDGTHTTIQAAINAASAGDTVFIRSKSTSYAEDLTLKAGVNLTGFTCDGSLSSVSNVIIKGNATFTGAGTVTISGVQLKTNGGAFLTVSGSAASIVNLLDCYLAIADGTAISFSSSSSSAAININNCYGTISGVNIAIFSHSSAGVLSINNSNITNSGGSTTVNTASAGILQLYYTVIHNPITTSGTNAFAFVWSSVSTANLTCLTIGGSGSQSIIFSYISAGTASAISISSSAAIVTSEVFSTNANTIAGTGVLYVSEINFNGVGNNATIAGTIDTTQTQFITIGKLNLITPLQVAQGGTGDQTMPAYSLVCGGTSTTGAFQSVSDVATGQVLTSGGVGALPAFSATPSLTSITLGGGTALANYAEGTFTPIVSGTTSAGAGTYSVQNGNYTRIGNIVFFQAYLVWSAHTGTGNILAGGLPLTSRNSSNELHCCSVWYSNFTYTAASFLQAYVNPNDTTLNLTQMTATAAAASIPIDTAASMMFCGQYRI